MERDAHAEIRAAMSKQLDDCEFPSDRSSRRLLAALLKKNPTVRPDFSVYVSALCRVLVPELYAKRSVRSEKALDEALDRIARLRYEVIASIVVPFIKRASRALYGKPVGAPPKLSPSDEKRIAGMVRTFRRNGMTMRSAIMASTRDYDISIRHAYRVCKKFGIQ